MADLNIVSNGALLIRNGIIEEVGPARRVENLAGARHAKEIDATGRVVMPAFVDADVGLVVPTPSADGGEGRDPSSALRIMSRKKVQFHASAVAAEWARYGCLTVGAHTACAGDLRNVSKVLRTHQALQSRPLRIRSIFSPQLQPVAGKTQASVLETLISKWMPAVRQKKLSSVMELTVGGTFAALDSSMLYEAAVIAAGFGYTIRLRSSTRLEAAQLQLALAAGAIAIVAPPDDLQLFTGRLSAIGCVRVIPASEGFDDPSNAAMCLRMIIDQGAAVAISSTYRTRRASSFNMQYLLHLAVDRLGLSPEEAITATTWNPACSLRLSHVTGSLEPGKSADLLLMDVPDYRELPRRAGHHDVSIVMRAGHIVSRNTGLVPV